MTLRRAFRIEGRVQGVGFRAWVHRRAAGLQLSGLARNETDGSVTVVAEGSAEALAQIAELLRRGPVLARVDRVQAIDPPDGPLSPGFRITG